MRILAAEDDPGDRELITRAFENSEIVDDLVFVEDGEQVMDYLTHRGIYANPESSPRPDLILLDLNMPKMGGMDVLEAIRNIPDLSSIPSVILTTSRQTEDISEAYRLGANSYITKPISMKLFSSIVKKLEEYWFCTVQLPSP